jgi:hypothetical protein
MCRKNDAVIHLARINLYSIFRIIFQAKSRILSFARNLSRFRQRRTKQGVRSKRRGKRGRQPSHKQKATGSSRRPSD